MLLQKSVISVAFSLLPDALSANDKTKEETCMKFARSAGGFSGISHITVAYERWCTATSTRAQYHKKLLDMCGNVILIALQKGSTKSWRKLKLKIVRKQ